MSRNRCVVDATPAEVFRVLADARSYAEWVVGAKNVRSVEGDWPAPGARFHHTVGVGPIEVKDNTQVVEVERDRRLVLSARARPAGIARVVFTLEPADGGKTRIVMDEEPISGPAKLIPKKLLDPLSHMRNAEALRRLKKRVEQQKVG